MFKHLLKGLLSALAFKVLDQYRHLSIQWLRIEAAKSYLHGIRMARLSAIGLMLMGLMIGLISFGFLFFHVWLFILLPWTIESKAILGMLLGLAYMIIGGGVLGIMVDEKTWLEKSGAAEMLNKAIGQSQKD